MTTYRHYRSRVQITANERDDGDFDCVGALGIAFVCRRSVFLHSYR